MPGEPIWQTARAALSLGWLHSLTDHFPLVGGRTKLIPRALSRSGPTALFIRPPGLVLSALAAAAGLSGCWAPPAARLPAGAKPGLLVKALKVEKLVRSARVESVDCGARTVKLSSRDGALGTYVIAPDVKHWRALRVGEEIDAEVRNVLTVSIPPPRKGLDRDTMTHPPDARVLIAEPSYRLLTLQYPDGSTDTFKVALDAQLRTVTPGSWVAIHPDEVLGLRARGHPPSGEGACPNGAASTP